MLSFIAVAEPDLPISDAWQPGFQLVEELCVNKSERDRDPGLFTRRHSHETKTTVGVLSVYMTTRGQGAPIFGNGNSVK